MVKYTPCIFTLISHGAAKIPGTVGIIIFMHALSYRGRLQYGAKGLQRTATYIVRRLRDLFFSRWYHLVFTLNDFDIHIFGKIAEGGLKQGNEIQLTAFVSRVDVQSNVISHSALKLERGSCILCGPRELR